MPNARLLRIEDTNEEVQWRLLTENGEVIDEPDDGCPAASFTTTDLLGPRRRRQRHDLLLVA